MKRITITVWLLSLMSVTIQAHNYVSSSVLASGNIVKLQVNTTCICRLSYEQIAEMGIYPPQVRILGYGGNLINQDFSQQHYDDVPSIPFYMNKGTDGIFSPGDYILFYCQGPIGWQWNSNIYKRTLNYYANYGCYFISDNAGEQRLITMSDTLAAQSVYEVYTYTALQLHEQEKVNLVDISGVAGGGREWYGESMGMYGSMTVPFTFADVATNQSLRCRVYAAASSGNLTTLTARVANASKSTNIMAIHDQIQANTTIVDISTPATSNSLPVSLSYSASSNTDKLYLNYIEMQVPCTLRLRDNYLVIRNTEYVGESQLSRYHLLGADGGTEVWNITDPVQTYRVNTTWQGDTLCWLGSNLTPQVFVAVRTNTSDYVSPASRGQIANQNLHAALRGKQHIIVTPSEFASQAERLKQVHEQHNPKEHWQVVDIEDVYNEFSSGTPDASAIRWMMKYLWDTFQGTPDAPQSVLLFGDGSFDNRQILSTSGTPYLLTYQAHYSTEEPRSYATDDYFGWLDDKDGVTISGWSDPLATMEIGVGRLPVATYEQAEQVVSKIATYLQNGSTGSWKQQLCFLADDGDSGDHVKSAEKAAIAVRAQTPEYIINKIYLDAYEQEKSASGERYPLAQSTYNNLLNSGVLIMDYAGHGSANNICSEMFLTRNQVENMTNTHLGIWVLATCNFAHFDQRDISTAEVAVLNAQGGAIAVVSSDRTAYVGPNEIINQNYCTNLVTHLKDGRYPYSIGEALRLAKNQMGNREGKLPYVLLGDPSIKLNYPEPYQLRITQMPDTLRALDLVTIKGYVADSTLDTVPYTGQLTINVFDKQQTMITKDNDQSDPSQKVLVEYLDFPNKLFTGQSNIENGLFTAQFRMPKDLRYNIDFARLTLYATGMDASGLAEAIGYSEDFKVGGSSPLAPVDKEGPTIKLYLNTLFFKEGDIVNPAPHFYAELYDANGINAAGSGIGHDLLLTIDNDVKQSYVVNNYYTSLSGSYQEGLVSYPMTTMADGNHTLTFRAWDMLNNSSSQSMGFTVNSEQGPELKRMIVYPNPVSRWGELNMHLQYDRPDNLSYIDMTFYDLTGHTVWTTQRSLYSVDAKAIFTLNMSETNMPAGVYIYQFRIQTSTQSSVPYSGRIIVY